MHQRVLDVEVVLVVKDGDFLLSIGSGNGRGGRGIVSTIGRDGDRGEVDLRCHRVLRSARDGWVAGDGDVVSWEMRETAVRSEKRLPGLGQEGDGLRRFYS